MTSECERCGGTGVIKPSQRLGYAGVCQVCDGSGWVVRDWSDGPILRGAEDEFDDEPPPLAAAKTQVLNDLL